MRHRGSRAVDSTLSSCHDGTVVHRRTSLHPRQCAGTAGGCTLADREPPNTRPSPSTFRPIHQYPRSQEATHDVDPGQRGALRRVSAPPTLAPVDRISRPTSCVPNAATRGPALARDLGAVCRDVRSRQTGCSPSSVATVSSRETVSIACLRHMKAHCRVAFCLFSTVGCRTSVTFTLARAACT